MTAPVLWESLLGLGMGSLLAALGYRVGLLTVGSGAVVFGSLAVTFGLAGWEWGGLLVVHLVAEGLWARFRLPAKQTLGDCTVASQVRRAAEMLARLGWPTLLALYQRLGGDTTLAYAAFVGAVAAATADVWNTEVGMLSPQRPRLITTRRQVPHGTAGAISMLGIVSALGGAWLIGFCALGLMVLSAWIAMSPWTDILLWIPLAATFGGLAGSLVDSLLGATAQVVYHCDRCGERTEMPEHRCGDRARRVRGIPWLSGDAIDLVAGLVGAAVTALMVGLVAGL